MAKSNGYRDPGGRHIRVYSSLLNSPAYRVIGFASKALFFDLRDKLTGSNNGSIAGTLSEMRHKGWSSSATLAKALYELRAMGFIAVTVEGGLKQRQRTPSLYRFTDLPVYEQPRTSVQAMGATDDYLRFKTVREAEKALTVLFSELQESGRKKQIRKNFPVQNLNRTSSESELKSDVFNSENEQVVVSSVQKVNTGENGGKPLKGP